MVFRHSGIYCTGYKNDGINTASYWTVANGMPRIAAVLQRRRSIQKLL
jgi:hypothetical protein